MDKSTMERKLDLLFEAVLHIAFKTLDVDEFEELENDLRGINKDYIFLKGVENEDGTITEEVTQ